MKVIVSEEDTLKFDNGLILMGDHDQDCCEINYLDFEQLPVGTELPTLLLPHSSIYKRCYGRKLR